MGKVKVEPDTMYLDLNTGNRELIVPVDEPTGIP